MKTTVFAAAKINLFLEVLGKRKDSYHFIETVMQSISIYDTITVEKNSNESEIKMRGSFSSKNQPFDNTAYLAATAFLSKANIKTGLNISIKKKIPISAGLAGGSADAAAVLVALDKIFPGKFSNDELRALGEKIGADVAFCVNGGCAFVEGVGEKITNIDANLDYSLVVIKPYTNILTKNAYKFCDDHKFVAKNSGKIVDLIKNGNLNGVLNNLFNRFESVLSLEEVLNLKDELKDKGAANCLMSGTGPCVFGVFFDEKKSQECLLYFKKIYSEVFLCKPVDFGCKILGN